MLGKWAMVIISLQPSQRNEQRSETTASGSHIVNISVPLLPI
jgi:hypothetical protein